MGALERGDPVIGAIVSNEGNGKKREGRWKMREERGKMGDGSDCGCIGVDE